MACLTLGHGPSLLALLCILAVAFFLVGVSLVFSQVTLGGRRLRRMTGMEDRKDATQSVVHGSAPDCNEVSTEIAIKCFKTFTAM